MKKIPNKLLVLFILLVGLIFMINACGPTYVRTKRAVVYRRVTPVPVVVVRRNSPPPVPVRAKVRIGF